jgi:hypothetical protein
MECLVILAVQYQPWCIKRRRLAVQSQARCQAELQGLIETVVLLENPAEGDILLIRAYNYCIGYGYA